MIILNDNLYFHKQFTLLDNQLSCIEIMFKMPKSANAGIFRRLYFFNTLI